MKDLYRLAILHTTYKNDHVTCSSNVQAMFLAKQQSLVSFQDCECSNTALEQHILYTPLYVWVEEELVAHTLIFHHFTKNVFFKVKDILFGSFIYFYNNWKVHLSIHYHTCFALTGVAGELLAVREHFLKLSHCMAHNWKMVFKCRFCFFFHLDATLSGPTETGLNRVFQFYGTSGNERVTVPIAKSFTVSCFRFNATVIKGHFSLAQAVDLM